MTQVISIPIKDKDDEIREYYLKRLEQLSLKSLGEVPQLIEPSFEQKAWVVRKMKRSFT